MARRRCIVVLCLMLLMPYTLFLPERVTPTATYPAPPDKVVHYPDSVHPERAQYVTTLLLTPTFPFHVLWITVLAVFCIVSVAELFLKCIFICCTLGIEAATGHGKPRLELFSRGAYNFCRLLLYYIFHIECDLYLLLHTIETLLHGELRSSLDCYTH